LREVRRSAQSSEQRVCEPEDALRRELAALAERVRNADPWQALGVAAAANDESIRAAYAELAKRTHPDRFVGASDVTRKLAEELFGCVSRAFDAIRDAEARATWARQSKEAALDAEARDESERAVFAEREFTRGEGLLRARRVSEALQAFRNAVEAYPEECDYHVYLGWAHYLASPDAPGRVDQAIQMVMKGRKLAPDRRTPYLFLGRLSQAAGRIDNAEKMFARAIQLDPNCVEAMRELRLVRMRQDKAKGIVGRILRR
jgi:tetratricopeptide (TPR) repeat protein